jgi:predicted nucleotidyltransferase
MDKEQAIDLARRYKEIVAEKLPLKALYLYGSCSKENYREDSGIDIAVIVEYLNDNYFEDNTVVMETETQDKQPYRASSIDRRHG